MSKLRIKSLGMIKKGNKMLIPEVCHIDNCKIIPQKQHFVCDYHYSIMQLLREGTWSKYNRRNETYSNVRVTVE